jgi:circadian clock protein KaiC
LIPQQVYLIDGAPGAGRTTFALQYLLEGVQGGERCTYVMLSETTRELEAAARSHGWSLAGIEIIQLVPGRRQLHLPPATIRFAGLEPSSSVHHRAV